MVKQYLLKKISTLKLQCSNSKSFFLDHASKYVGDSLTLTDVEKRKIGCERIRLTVGEARGPALSDKNAPITQYIKTKEVVLFFKDLGPQVSWTTVFLVEYFGPILITLLLIFF